MGFLYKQNLLNGPDFEVSSPLTFANCPSLQLRCHYPYYVVGFARNAVTGRKIADLLERARLHFIAASLQLPP